MINCTIKTSEKSLKVELPMDMYLLSRQLYEELKVQMWPGYIKIGVPKGEITSIELTSTDEVGNHLIPLFSNQDSIEDINAAVNVVKNASEHIKEQLRGKIIADEYKYTNQMYRDIKEMIYTAAPIQETFYFPLTGTVYDPESGDCYDVSNETLLRNLYEIQEKLESYINCDTENMVQYYDEIGHEKMLSAIWELECIKGVLYGKVETRFITPMTPEELEKLKDWIAGQNSDGAGEGFEQQDIETEDGRLNVSFWHHGDNYFIYNQEEMDAYIAEQANGGISMN